MLLAKQASQSFSVGQNDGKDRLHLAWIWKKTPCWMQNVELALADVNCKAWREKALRSENIKWGAECI